MRQNTYKRGTWNVVCSTCGVEKSITEYHKHPGSLSGYRPQCKKCKNIKAKEYRDNHKEKINERVSLWQKENRVKCNAATRRWRESNKDKDAQRAAQRRLKIKQQTPSWSSKEYRDIWYQLARMESERTGRKVHVDHIVPLKGKFVCGLHCEDNMQLMFAEDNWSKRNVCRG